MDYKTLRKHLAQQLDRTPGEVDSLVQGLALTVRKAVSEQNRVAIPSFGTFYAENHKEVVSRDLTSGENLLLPPEIILNFQPGAMLLKLLRHE